MREPTRTERVEVAATMVRRHGVPIERAALCLKVDVSEVRIALGMDVSVRRMV